MKTYEEGVLDAISEYTKTVDYLIEVYTKAGNPLNEWAIIKLEFLKNIAPSDVKRNLLQT